MNFLGAGRYRSFGALQWRPKYYDRGVDVRPIKLTDDVRLQVPQGALSFNAQNPHLDTPVQVPAGALTATGQAPSPGGYLAPIKHIASATAAVTGTTATVVIPASTQTDDVLIVFAGNSTLTADPTVTDDDSGGNTWTKLSGLGNAGATMNGSVWWKRATGATASKTVTVTHGSAANQGVAVSVFRGCLLAGTPVTDVASQTNLTTDHTHTPGFTPGYEGAFTLLAVVSRTNSAYSSEATATSPGTLTEFYDFLGAGSGCTLTLAGAQQTVISATGDFSWSVASSTQLSFIMALQPEPLSKNIGIPKGDLTLNGFAPAVSAGGAAFSVTVPVGALTLNAFVPGILRPVSVPIPVGSLTLNGFAPGLGTKVNVPLGTLTANGLVPLVVTPQLITVPAGALTLNGFAPAASVAATFSTVVPVGNLSMTGLAPAANLTANLTIFIPPGDLSFGGYNPAIQIEQFLSDHFSPEAGTGGLWTQEGAGSGAFAPEVGLSKSWTQEASVGVAFSKEAPIITSFTKELPVP